MEVSVVFPIRKESFVVGFGSSAVVLVWFVVFLHFDRVILIGLTVFVSDCIQLVHAVVTGDLSFAPSVRELLSNDGANIFDTG